MKLNLVRWGSSLNQLSQLTRPLQNSLVKASPFLLRQFSVAEELPNGEQTQRRQRTPLPQWKQKLSKQGHINQLGKQVVDLAHLKKRLQHDDISILEHLQYIKNQHVQDSHNITTMLLCSFLKKLFHNEGINEEEDDIFRAVYTPQRKKVSNAILSRQEVHQAVQKLLEEVRQLQHDKIVALFTFLVKADYPLTEQQLKNICKGLKIASLQIESKQTQNLLLSISIFMKMSQKLMQGEHDPTNKPFYPVIKEFFLFLQPIIEQQHSQLGLNTACMMLKSLSSQKLTNYPFVIKILKVQLNNLESGNNLEIYSILDTIGDALQGRMGSDFDNEDGIYVLRNILKEVNIRCRDPTKYNLLPYELGCMSKCLSNKKELLPGDLPELREFFTNMQYLIQDKLDHFQLSAMLYILNSFQRYNVPTNEQLSQQLLQRMQVALTNESKALQDVELYRLSVSLLSISTTPDSLVRQLLDLFIERFKEAAPSDSKKRQNLKKFILGLMGRLKAQKRKVPNELFGELKEVLNTV